MSVVREKIVFSLRQFDRTILFLGEMERIYIIAYLHILLLQFSLSLCFHRVYVRAMLSIKLLKMLLAS